MGRLSGGQAVTVQTFFLGWIAFWSLVCLGSYWLLQRG